MGTKMPLKIQFESRKFVGAYAHRSGVLTTDWDELIWAALTIGRPATYHLFRHGPASFNEALFRMSLLRMAVEETPTQELRRTDVFVALDPTEKGMVSYYLGMTLCKLFSARILGAPWLLHLDLYRHLYNASTLGRSRPDLFGDSVAGEWFGFECKGRSNPPSAADKRKAKLQAKRLKSVGGISCTVNAGTFAFFKDDILQFYWRDPEPSQDDIELPRPREEWRYYYEPALSLTSAELSPTMKQELELADIQVRIHPRVLALLREGLWEQAREFAKANQQSLIADRFRPDGIRVISGSSWRQQLREPAG